MRDKIGVARDRAQGTSATGCRGSARGRAILLGAVGFVLALTIAAGSAAAATITIDSGTRTISSATQVQHGRLTSNGIASSCAAPKAAPAVTAPGSTFPYVSFGDTNYDDTSTCLTFTISPACTPAQALSSAAYLGSSYATNPAQNYLADNGTQSSSPTSFSATIPTDGYWTWVVTGTSTCSSYGYTVTSPAPVATSIPTINETASLGMQLSVYSGSWPGTSGAAFAYHWLRCDASGNNCGQEATGYAATFTPSTSDEGHTLKVAVTDTYNGASATATSPASNVVPSNPPVAKYTVATTSGHQLTPGTTLLTGAQGDDHVVDTALPFPVTLDGVTHGHAFASTNGNLQFVDTVNQDNTAYSNTCLPSNQITNMVAPYWDDLDSSASIDPSLGIFTATSGVAPHRVFVIEWRTASHNDTTKRFNFEIVLHEGSPTIGIVYGAMAQTGDSATIGLQGEQDAAYDTLIGCNSPGTIAPGQEIDLTPSAPSISGTPQAGQVLTGADATYVAGASPLNSATVWQLCDAGGAGCSAAGAGATLPLTAAMVGHTVRLASTATDPEGTASTVSAPTAVISAASTGGGTPSGGGGSPPGGTPPGGGSPGGSHGTARPKIVALRLASPTLRTAGSDALTILASAGGRARIVIARQLSGRRAGRRCVTPTRRNRHARRCTRLRTVRTLTDAMAAKQTGGVLITGRGLSPGRYVVTVTVTGAGGASSPVRRTLIVRASH